MVGDLIARHSTMKGVDVPPERAPSMIDEYPDPGGGRGLRRGPDGDAGPGRADGQGKRPAGPDGRRPARVRRGGYTRRRHADGGGRGGRQPPGPGRRRVATHGDHRIAMAHLVLGLASEQPVSVDEPGMIATSFPGFVELMTGLGRDRMRRREGRLRHRRGWSRGLGQGHHLVRAGPRLYGYRSSTPACSTGRSGWRPSAPAATWTTPPRRPRPPRRWTPITGDPSLRTARGRRGRQPRGRARGGAAGAAQHPAAVRRAASRAPCWTGATSAR